MSLNPVPNSSTPAGNVRLPVNAPQPLCQVSLNPVPDSSTPAGNVRLPVSAPQPLCQVSMGTDGEAVNDAWILTMMV